ncbi:MAG: DMT family transporter [Promethearchaeota archaeon]
MLISASCMAIVGIFVRYMPLSVFGVVEFRGIFGFLWTSLLIILLRKTSIIRKMWKTWKFLFIFIIVNSLCIMFYFMAILLTGLSAGAFLLYLGPLFAVYFLKVGLKEEVSRATYLSYAFAVAGLLLIMRPWSDGHFNAGFIFGILSAVFLGGLSFLKKYYFMKMDRGEFLEDESKDDVSYGLTWFSTLGLAASFSSSIFFEGGNMATMDAVVPGLLLGLIPTTLGFTFYNFALQGDRGGHIIILSYMEPVVASITGILIDPAEFHALIILGGALIMLGNVIVNINKTT